MEYSLLTRDDRGTEFLEPDVMTPDQFFGLLRQRSWQDGERRLMAAVLQDGIENFGMAFVSNSADDKCDRIYGNHYNGVAMGKDASEFFSVDPVTLGLVQLGKSDYGLAEVTGTGDGRAFLFAGPDPADLIEVDKTTGDTISTIPLPGVKTGGGFAFAFFAGDFYFFTDAESDGTSEVTHIDYDDSDMNGKQDLKVVLQDAPLRVVGAGVSTCAPLIPQ